MARNRVCHVNDVPPGTSLGFRYAAFGHDDLFVVNHLGRLYGYRNSCPHWSGSTLPLNQSHAASGVASHELAQPPSDEQRGSG